MDPQVSNLLAILDNPSYSALFIALIIWNLIWKGFALWKAARSRQRNWFIAILILNTFGILEIIYIFYFGTREGEKNMKE
ncbi:DUF5652 family protein [Candidatus Parcubacteria bacterium]|nr:DUF5652 family protein [Candidatus Parcubacteria bacterium]